MNRPFSADFLKFLVVNLFLSLVSILHRDLCHLRQFLEKLLPWVNLYLLYGLHRADGGLPFETPSPLKFTLIRFGILLVRVVVKDERTEILALVHFF